MKLKRKTIVPQRSSEWVVTPVDGRVLLRLEVDGADIFRVELAAEQAAKLGDKLVEVSLGLRQ